jgi:hypothetical protein
MIRSNVPVPLLFRLRMRANFMARRAQSRLYSNYRQRSGSDSSKLSLANQVVGRRAMPECSPQLWSEFMEQYERFTSALCCAAQYGCNAATEGEYTAVRGWMGSRYAVIARQVRPHLDVEFDGKVHETDMLLSLFESSSLHDLLHGDHGDLIPRVGRVSNAVYRCHAHITPRAQTDGRA